MKIEVLNCTISKAAGGLRAREQGYLAEQQRLLRLCQGKQTGALVALGVASGRVPAPSSASTAERARLAEHNESAVIKPYLPHNGNFH